tara:strand:- start:6512 stop:6772 length:261 start_codon:yes stop_codon:yes gene_type:complete
MSWEEVIKDNKELVNAIQKFVDDITEPHLAMIKVWSELKKNIPEEEMPRYEELMEQFGHTILEAGKMAGDLVHAYNAHNRFSEDFR